MKTKGHFVECEKCGKPLSCICDSPKIPHKCLDCWVNVLEEKVKELHNPISLKG